MLIKYRSNLGFMINTKKFNYEPRDVFIKCLRLRLRQQPHEISRNIF